MSAHTENNDGAVTMERIFGVLVMLLNVLKIEGVSCNPGGSLEEYSFGLGSGAPFTGSEDLPCQALYLIKVVLLDSGVIGWFFEREVSPTTVYFETLVKGGRDRALARK